MLPFKRPRPERPPWPTIAVLLALVAFFQIYQWQTARRQAGGWRGGVELLTVARQTPDAAGRPGDLVLRTDDGATITIAASPNIAGHRPLLGSIVDVSAAPAGASDPLIGLQTALLDAAGNLTELSERTPQPFKCADGATGVRGYGAFGVGVTTEACASSAARFTLRTTVTSLPGGASVVDELNVGSHPVVVDGDGAAWDAERDTRFVASAYGGTAVMLEAPKMHVSRSFSRFGAEVFPSPVVVRYGEGSEIERTLHVLHGDVLHAIARLGIATRVLDVTFGPGKGGDISLHAGAGRVLATGHVEKGETRVLRLPPDFGEYLVLRDDQGIVTDAHVPLPASGGSVQASPSAAGSVTLAYRDDAGAPLPVHVLIKGISGTEDPAPAQADDRTVIAGRSLYARDGATHVTLAPGHYRVTASHGMTYSLSVNDVTVAPSAEVSVNGTLRRVVDTSDWVAADFHLHSAPSPDSDVSLADRVVSLGCEGVDLAVATDHNRVTDFAPDVQALGLSDRLATAPGVEITSAGQRWGHFNAYPLPLPSGAPEDAVPVYFGKRPAEMFASARQLGARVVQVNHARMDPGIGYFDLAHLDPKTGRAGGEFSSDFDTFEAFNGMWIERPEKVREGPVDLVALARRGKRVAALGDSDSHKLLYEEAGYPRTFVHTPRDPVSTRFDRVTAVLLGAADTTVTSGPFVEMSVDGHPVGSVVKPATGSVHVSVRVSAPAWVPVEHVEIWRDDTVVQRYPVPGPAKDGVRFEAELDVPVTADAVILAWADAETPLPDVLPYEHALAIGFTGLVYVDADRDGKVTVPPASP